MPFFHQIPPTPLTIPFFCHTGLEDWPKQANARSKSVKKSQNLEKFTFLTLTSKFDSELRKKG